MHDVPLPLNAWLRWGPISELVAEERPSSILELGIGGGAVASRLATMTPRYVGYEPDPVSRELATSRLPDGTEVIDDLDRITGERFGLVCAFEVIEHIDDDGAALAQWVDCLEPGGRLILSTPAFAAKMGAWDHRVGHHRRYDPDEMAQMLESAGLSDVSVTVIGFPLGHLLELARNLVARASSPGDTSMESRTAGSGRLFQPTRGASVTKAVTAPFRAIQRRFPDRGTGLVAVGRLDR